MLMDPAVKKDVCRKEVRSDFTAPLLALEGQYTGLDCNILYYVHNEYGERDCDSMTPSHCG
jgi:hypothetical protein